MLLNLILKDGSYHEINCKLLHFSDEEIVVETDFVAAKLWCIDDIKDCLQINGFEPSDHNVNEVMNTHYLDDLNNCTDGDWSIIHDAIHYAASRDWLTHAKGD